MGNLKYTDSDKVSGKQYAKGTIKGTGIGLDLNIGRSIAKNQFLTLDLLTTKINSPQVSKNNSSFNTESNLKVYEFTYGLRYTYYLMPANIYLAATFGGAVIGYTINSDNQKSNLGNSTLLSVGKIWPTGKGAWSYGINLTYSYTKTKMTDEDTIESTIGNRLFISGIISFH